MNARHCHHRPTRTQATLLALCLTLSVRADYQSTVVSQGPFTYWRLNETASTTSPVTNAANLGFLGSSWDGQYHGGQAFFRGAVGALTGGDAAAFFDGRDQAIQTQYDPLLNPPSNFSVEAWLAPDVIGSAVPNTTTCALSCGDFASPRAGWLLYQTTFGWSFRMYNLNGTTPSLNLNATTNMVASNYYHVVVTYDGAQARIYVNSRLLNTGTPASYVPGNGGPLSIGARSDNLFYWRGRGDEVAFYNSVLNQSTITAHYQARTSAANYFSQVQALNPVVYYHLNEPGDTLRANLGSFGSGGAGDLVYPAAAGLIGPSPPEFSGFESLNRAVDFVGGGYMQARPLNLNTNGLTITCWLRPSGSQPPDAGVVFHRGQLAPGGPYSTAAGLKFGGVSGLDLTYNWDGDDATYRWNSGVSVVDAAWNFAALIVQPDRAIVFVPGGPNPTPATNFIAHATLPFEGGTYVGIDPFTNAAATARNFVGTMDEVAIFRRALSLGETYSQYAAAVGNLPPKVFADPRSPSTPIYTGDPLTLAVDAGGTPNLGYQWRKNGIPIAGATQSSFTIPSLATTNSGSYFAVVTNAVGTLSSGTANLSVLPQSVPAIVQNVSSNNRPVYPGGNINLSVMAAGGSLSYQWRKNGANLAGKTTPALVITGVTNTDTGAYSVVVANTQGSVTSAVANITVPSPSTNSFEAAVSTDAPISWYRMDDGFSSPAMLDAMGRFDGFYTNQGGPVSPGVIGALNANGNTAVHFDLFNRSWGEVPARPPPVTTGDFTFECWMRTFNSTDYLCPLSSFRNQYGLLLIRTPDLLAGDAAGFGDLDTASARTGAINSPPIGTWTHLVSTFTPGVGRKVYVNGVWDGRGPFNDFSRNLNTPLRVGSAGPYPDGLEFFFDGEIDEVAVYNKALSDAQILAHYQAALSGNNALPFFTGQPFSQTPQAGSSVGIPTQVGGTLPINYQWLKNGLNYPANGPTLSFPNVTAADAGNYQVVIGNSFGSVTSAVATLTVVGANNPPVITNQPQSVAACQGSLATFTVAADGTAPFTYQWRLFGGNISAATNVSYAVAAQPSSIGDYTVVVANSAGSATSSIATLTLKAPTTASGPGNQAACLGSAASFNTVASGSGTIFYQWRKSGANLSGATNSSYTIAAVTAGDVATYSAVVTADCGSVTNNATLTLKTATTASAPANQVVCPGSSASFSTVASGSGTIFYQWRKNGVNLGGATNSSYAIASVAAGDVATYSAVVTADCGSVTNSATLTLNAQTTASVPLDQAVCLGRSASFNTVATGSGTIFYQWRKSGANLSGATNSSYTIAAVTAGDAATYSAVVTADCGSVTNSASLTLNVQTAATALTNLTRLQGQSATFSTTASGTGPFAFVWSRNGGALSGQTNSSLTLPSVTPADAGTYVVVVTGNCNAVTNSATLTVNVPPAITSPPQSQNVSCGGPLQLSVSATGDPPLAYQWKLNGVAINNATNSVFNRASVTPADAGPYVVTVGNSFGAATSSVATVTVMDTLPPIITLPAPPVAECAGPSGTPVTFAATALDACVGAVPVDYSHPPGTSFPVGATVVTVTALDPSSNVATGTFTVTVRDTTSPQPAVCLDPPVALEQGGRNLPAGGPASPSADLLASLQGQPTRAFDEAAPGATFAHSMENLPECVSGCTLEFGLKASGPTSLDDTVSLGFAENGIFNPLWTGRLGEAGTNGALLTHLPWTSGAQEVVVLDLARLLQADGTTLNLVPMLAQKRFLDLSIANDTLVDFTKLVTTSCRDRADVLVTNAPGQAGALVNYAYPAFTDACDSALTVSSPYAPGSFFPIGRTVVPVTAVDHSGNVGLSWFAVLVRDNEPPVLHCQPVQVDCVCSKESGTPVFYPIEATDNSGHVTVQCFPPSGSTFPPGTTMVNCFATDPSGNTAQCSFPVSVIVPGTPRIRTAQLGPTQFNLSFDTEAGKRYVVEYRNQLQTGSWNSLIEVMGNGSMATVNDPLTASARFYRINQPAAPQTNCSLATIYEPPEPPPGSPEARGQRAEGRDQKSDVRSQCLLSALCPLPSDSGPPNVYLFSGEFHYEEVDLCIKGRGLDFVWARKYRSCICYVTPMGYGWDWSYNICIIPNGPDVDVLDGNTRRDTFHRQQDGSFVADQFFREGRFQPDGRFVLTFADQGTWQFRPLGGAAGGRIERITDRNGNALRFNYDSIGRLTNVLDTLDRAIAISYDADGFFAAVTDFTGRQVRYTHYRDSEPGGSFSDLKTVVSPAVTGTPNGNDFPGGKTNSYTYSEDFADKELNHNLLTVTDGKGQPWLQNTYSQQPACDCAQVVRQVWGYPNETLEYSYHVQTPTLANNFAIMKTIVNDRVGNVSEFYYDVGNRCVIHRAFTGRAVPGVTTTATENRPAGKLRATDPDVFETRHEWNVDSLPVRITHPNGNVTENVYELELNPAAARRARGNLRVCRKLPGPLGGDQPALIELFEYDAGLGSGCCDVNFVTKHTDARGNITLHSYDARGNRLRTQHRVPTAIEDWGYNEFGQVIAHWSPDNGTGHRRRDDSTYYGAGPQRGYLAQQIVDAGGLALTTTFEYDPVGNVVRAVDPRGHDTLYTVNARNQVVRETSREVTPGSGVRYARDFFYDANDNLVRVDIENRDDAGVLQSNTHQSTIFDYEILNRVVRVAQEKGAAHPLNGVLNYEAIPFALRPQFIVTENAYDANRNRTLVRFGEATAGFDPFNVVASSYDERDLLFGETRAAGSGLQSTTQHDYDGNKNLTRVSQGTENTPRVTLLAYDGFNRQTSATDAMGNVRSSHYDGNNNCVAVRLDGEAIDLNGGAGNVRLAEAWLQYDAMDRLTREDKLSFDPTTQFAIGDGYASTLTFHNDNSQVIRVTDDRGYSTTTAHDTANRRQSVIDPKTNSVSYAYDANGNVLVTTETERSDLGNPPQTFTTTNEYDGLDRLTQTLQSGGTNRYAYDSRNNRVRETDALGHETRFAFDGLNRLVQTVRDLNGNGANANEAADIVTSQAWDDSCRLIAQVDDNNHTTRYACDALNRRIITRFADGTFELNGSGSVNWPDGDARPQLNESFFNGYDPHDNATRTTDANLTVVVASFDLLNRPVSKSIARAPGVLGATFETRRFDGRSLLVQARNNDTLVNRTYDSLCNLLRETINLDPPAFSPTKDRVTTWTYDGVGNPNSCVYPGGRMVTRTYDGLNRVARICDGACVEPPPPPPASGSLTAQYFYVGPSRLEARCYGNGTCVQFAYNAARLPTGTTNRQTSTGVVLDQRVYGWNADGNKTSQANVRPGGPLLGYAYTYDAANRLTRTVVSSPINPAERDSTYTLDGVGNRLNVSSDPPPGNYTLNPSSPDPADAQVNQYSATPFEAARQHDANGNLVASSGGGGSRAFQYDYRNLLVKATIGTNTPTLFTYDALGRRVQRANGASITRMFHDGDRELEEQDAAGNTLATHVAGCAGTERLNSRRGVADFYFHSDDLGNVTALTDAAGNVAERYDYGDFGEPACAAYVQAADAVTAFDADVDGNNFIADDFSFNRLVRVSGVRWWGAYRSGTLPVTDQFTIRIHADNAGRPASGAALSTTTAGNNVHRVATGRLLPGPAAEFIYEAQLTTPFDAQPGTLYWLEIANNTSGSSVVWGISSAGYGNQRLSSGHNSNGPWQTIIGDMAFELLTGPSDVTNPYLFRGTRYDPQTGFYQEGARQLDPLLGRFTTRDPAGIWQHPGNLGNPFTFHAGNPGRIPEPVALTVFLPQAGCSDWEAVAYCPRLASLWGQPYFCWLKGCGPHCASYTCCQRPVRRCATLICGAGNVEKPPACLSGGNTCSQR